MMVCYHFLQLTRLQFQSTWVVVQRCLNAFSINKIWYALTWRFTDCNWLESSGKEFKHSKLKINNNKKLYWEADGKLELKNKKNHITLAYELMTRQNVSPNGNDYACFAHKYILQRSKRRKKGNNKIVAITNSTLKDWLKTISLERSELLQLLSQWLPDPGERN